MCRDEQDAVPALLNSDSGNALDVHPVTPRRTRSRPPSCEWLQKQSSSLGPTLLQNKAPSFPVSQSFSSSPAKTSPPRRSAQGERMGRSPPPGMRKEDCGVLISDTSPTQHAGSCSAEFQTGAPVGAQGLPVRLLRHRTELPQKSAQVMLILGAPPDILWRKDSVVDIDNGAVDLAIAEVALEPKVSTCYRLEARRKDPWLQPLPKSYVSVRPRSPSPPSWEMVKAFERESGELGSRPEVSV